MLSSSRIEPSSIVVGSPPIFNCAFKSVIPMSTKNITNEKNILFDANRTVNTLFTIAGPCTVLMIKISFIENVLVEQNVILL